MILIFSETQQSQFTYSYNSLVVSKSRLYIATVVSCCASNDQFSSIALLYVSTRALYFPHSPRISSPAMSMSIFWEFQRRPEIDSVRPTAPSAGLFYWLSGIDGLQKPQDYREKKPNTEGVQPTTKRPKISVNGTLNTPERT